MNKKKTCYLIFAFLSINSFLLIAQELGTDSIPPKLEQPGLPSIPEYLNPLTPLAKLNLPEETNFLPELEKQMLKDNELITEDMLLKFGFDTKKEPNQRQRLPLRFQPGLDFTFNASRWDLPVLGSVTTFSPGMAYRFSENFAVYGGVGFSQIHNLSYIQNIVNPALPAKSNLLINGYLGTTYTIWDRIILRGSYQRSLFNELPANMMMIAPGQNVVSAGVSLDIWNGLGVTVEHVWEFDDYGRMRKGMRYSPYVDFKKFMKFLSGE